MKVTDGVRVYLDAMRHEDFWERLRSDYIGPVECCPTTPQPLTIHSEQPGHFVTTVGPMIRETGMPSRAIGREDADDKSAERQQPSKLHNEGSSPSSPSTSCTKCGKPKFGPWSTICSADIGKVNEHYCQCIEVFKSVPPAAETAHPELSDKDGWVYNPDEKLGEIRAEMGGAETAQFDKLKAALSLIENYDSSCECDDHTNPDCCANVPVSDCFCAHCIAGKALL